jgi:hypothetical protein
LKQAAKFQDIRVHDLAIVAKNSDICAKILHFPIFSFFSKKIISFQLVNFSIVCDEEFMLDQPRVCKIVEFDYSI